jgi:hypothetical protein
VRNIFVRTWPTPVAITAFGAAVEGPYVVPESLAAIVACAPAPSAVPARSLGASVLKMALGRALADPRIGTLPPPEARALVFGTHSAALNEVTQFIEEVNSLGANLVNPGLFPFTVMNAAAGITAIEYDCKGANLTLNNGASSALDALVYAADLVTSGAAGIVFAGGFESSRRDLDRSRPPGSLACVFAVTTLANAQAAGAQVSARLIAFGSGDLPGMGAPAIHPEILSAFEEIPATASNRPLPHIIGNSAEQSLLALLSAVQRLREEKGASRLAICSGGEQESFGAGLLLDSSPGIGS